MKRIITTIAIIGLLLPALTACYATVTTFTVTGKVIGTQDPYQGGIGSAWSWVTLENGDRYAISPNTHLKIGAIYKFTITEKDDRIWGGDIHITDYSMVSD